MKSAAVYQKHLDELKKLCEDREHGQALVAAAVEAGEALLSAVTPETRESVRTELRTLRDAIESLLDNANAVQKNIDSIMMQRASLDESQQQVCISFSLAEERFLQWTTCAK